MSKTTKLKSLTKEQKLALYDAIQLKKELVKQRREAFKPHAGQLPIITSDAKIRMVTAGNGFGKTALAVNEALWAASGFNPIVNKTTFVPAKIIVVLDSPSKVADVWLPELRKWAVINEEQLFKDGKPFVSRITFKNGSEMRFMFHLQEDLAFESIEADTIIFDEPPPRNVWVALLRAGRTKHREPRYLMIGTPIAQPWLREYFVDWEKGNYPDTQFFKGLTEQNKHNLADNYIEDFSRHLTERERKTRLQGAFFNTEGLALAELFNRQRHLVKEAQLPDDYKPSWPAVIAIDPHPNKPTFACVVVAAPDGTKYYVAETAQKVIPREFGRWLQLNWLAQYNIKDIVCDSLGNSDFTGGEGFKSFIEVLNSMGIRVRATTFDEKGDDVFLTRIQDGLFIPDQGEPTLKILNTCVGLIRDVENVSWMAQKGTETYKPKLDIGNKDYLACLKYALASNLTYDNSRRKIIRPPNHSPFGGNKKQPGVFQRRWRQETDTEDDW